MATVRKELSARDRELRAVELDLSAAASQRELLLRTGAGARDLRTIESRVTALGERRTSLADTRSELSGQLRDLSDAFSASLGRPELGVERLDGAIPIALLPVRIETRFTQDRATLRVRVYPDQVHIDTHDDALTADELEAGKRYWTERWQDLSDQQLAGDVWKSLCTGFRPGRARYVVERLRPQNQPADGDPRFPTVSLRAASWSVPASAAVLPDRIFAVGFRRIDESNYEEIFRVPGEHIPDRLQVGPSPGGIAREDDEASGFGLTEDGLAWIEQPDRAHDAGMLIEVTNDDMPSGRTLAQGVDRLIVVGVDWTLTPAEGAKAVEDLLTAHIHEGHLGFVAQGTPTNNTGTGRSGFTTDEATAATLLDPASPPPDFDDWSAARLTATALGIDSSTLDKAPGAGLREQRVGSALTDALWRATAGYYLTDMLSPLTAESSIDTDLRSYVAAHLFAPGPLPTMRVISQPYGILPVVAPGRFVPATGRSSEGIILRVARVLRDIVEPAIASVPRLGRAGEVDDVDKILLELLLRTPVPWSFRFRNAIGPVQLKAMGVNWEKIAAFQRTWTALIWSKLRAFQVTRLSELTLDTKDHPLHVSLVLKGATAEDPGNTNYLAEILALIADKDGRLALNLRENSEALLEALLACAAVGEIDWVGSHKGAGLATALGRPEDIPQVAYATNFHIPTPDLIRVEEEPRPTGPLANLQFSTPRALADAVIPQIDPTMTVAEKVTSEYRSRLADLSDLLRSPIDQFYWMGRFTDAVGELAETPPDTLEWGLRGHLDLFSSRLDAWFTSLAHSRLSAHRSARPKGLHVGCWGWVEDLDPDPAGSDSVGYVHAPSLAHAASTALLRSARNAHQDEDGEMFDIAITSRRTREALAVLQGVTQGQRVTALLGYRLERKLQEAGPRLAQYIWEFRNLAPMRSDEPPTGQPKQAIAARDVVDALLLLDRWQDDRAGLLADAGVAASHQPTVSAVLDEVAGIYDGVSDLLVSEAVHQAAQGNLERAGAALTAQDRHTPAPELDFVSTPRPGHTVSMRAGVVLQQKGAAPGWRTDPRSLAEPFLDRWVGEVLGPSDRFQVGATLSRGDTKTPLTPIDIRALGMGALSLCIASQRPAEGGASELEQRLALLFAEQVQGASEDDRIDLELDDPSGSTHGLGLLKALGDWVTQVCGAPPMTGEELRANGAVTLDQGGNPVPGSIPHLADLRQRVDDVAAALDDSIDHPETGLAAALAAPTPRRLRTALLRATSFDVGATPSVPLSHPDVVEILVGQATEAISRLEAIRSAVQVALDEPSSADPPEESERLRSMVKGMLGAEQPVLPLLITSDADEAMASLENFEVLTAGDPMAPSEWLERHALVRVPLDPLASLLCHAEASGRQAWSELRLVQTPHDPKSTWCALPFGENGAPVEGTSTVAFHSLRPIDFRQPWCGVVVDSWTETIPDSEEMTAITFHYDAPGSRAPQAVVLAVHPETSPKKWDFETLLDTVSEAADLAKLRTLSARELTPLDGFVPALYLPDDYTRDVPSVSIRDLLSKSIPPVTVEGVLGKG